MVGMFFFYCLVGAILGVIYYFNIKRNSKYSIENDKLFIVIILLVCAPFAMPIATALYLVWKFNNREG